MKAVLSAPAASPIETGVADSLLRDIRGSPNKVSTLSGQGLVHLATFGGEKRNFPKRQFSGENA
jgi:hypothetical protein